MDAASEVTRLLRDARTGDPGALNRLMPLVYDELRALAARHLRRERPGHTLATTALAHEAYLRLVEQREVHWQDRAHFLAIASTAIRRILVDHARGARAARRGGGREREHLREEMAVQVEPDIDLLALEEALTRLEELDPRKSRVVELRFFGGLTTRESAEVLSISEATVERDWSLARAWLYREVRKGDDGESSGP